LRQVYLSSLAEHNGRTLKRFEERMALYYQNRSYHREWIKGINANWQPGSHSAQIAMCRLIAEGAAVLEIGCGDRSAAAEILGRTRAVRYVGVDLTPELASEGAGQGRFVGASATHLPFRAGSFDVVLSMFVIEHVVFPARLLDEAWRLLRGGGRLLIVAPDFSRTPMASERVGLSYGAGREKLKAGKVIDALVTAYDARLRLKALRYLRGRELRRGNASFPILTEPRCFYLTGFVLDCDAVYPACPEEIVNYLNRKADLRTTRVFYRDTSTFGVMFAKR
jgi:SAM-dependent methyltransferase